MVDFIFIGPSKTASTWIFRLMQTHPTIYVPIAKDTYFFDAQYERGLGWYRTFFAQAPAGACRGELSHDYFSSAEAMRRIANDLPCAKLICCLRNPYDRIASSYRHRVRLGMEKDGFVRALRDTPSLINESRYGTHLAHIKAANSGNSLLVLDFDVLREDPKRFSDQITSFLEVDELPALSIPAAENVARASRSVTMSNIGKRLALFLRKIGAASLVGLLKHSRFVNRLFYREGEGPEENLVFPDDVIELLNEEIDRLGELLNQDFAKWKKIRN